MVKTLAYVLEVSGSNPILCNFLMEGILKLHKSYISRMTNRNWKKKGFEGDGEW